MDTFIRFPSNFVWIHHVGWRKCRVMSCSSAEIIVNIFTLRESRHRLHRARYIQRNFLLLLKMSQSLDRCVPACCIPMIYSGVNHCQIWQELVASAGAGARLHLWPGCMLYGGIVVAVWGPELSTGQNFRKRMKNPNFTSTPKVQRPVLHSVYTFLTVKSQVYTFTKRRPS